MELAVVPMEGSIPAYDKAIFVTSDASGRFEIALPPGRYRIVRKAKAENPISYVEYNDARFIEREVDVEELGPHAANIMTNNPSSPTVNKGFALMFILR